MLKIYNTLSRKKENFKPRKQKKVSFFVCGITPYDYSHIGHAKTYIVFDMIVKYLKEKKFNVFYLQNITDVDDKIIKRAKERKITPLKLARFFEKEYLKDTKALKINSITKYARATDHIKEIISQVERLLKKNFAYKINDGIYYDISKFKNYGKLAGRNVFQAEDGISRIDENIKKKNKGDFCLWKLSKPGEPKWPSPFGWGRPGWHIEDTAISEKYFSCQYDVHGGARDLIFPHHEAEVAQMEAISGKSPFVKYWLHSGFLTVKNQKMAKSLGNFITIRDFLKKHSPRILRFLVIKTHYRSPLDYNEKIISQAKKELEKIDQFITKVQNIKNKIQNKSNLQISKYEKEFEKAMENDFNTPKAIALIFKLIKQGNYLIDKNLLNKDNSKKIIKFLQKIDKYFNFIIVSDKDKSSYYINVHDSIKLKDNEIVKLIKQRENYRKQKNWQKADQLRKKIEKKGYLIEDTEQGSKIKKNMLN